MPDLTPAPGSRTPRRQLSESDQEEAIRLMNSAMGEFTAKGVVEHTRCGRCQGLVTIVQISDSVWRHDCPCGFFSGVLKGI